MFDGAFHLVKDGSVVPELIYFSIEESEIDRDMTESNLLQLYHFKVQYYLKDIGVNLLRVDQYLEWAKEVIANKSLSENNDKGD